MDSGEATNTLVSLVETEQAPILARPFYPDEGSPSPITASLAHVPEVLEATLPFVGRVLGPTAIDARTKEIVILRASALMECRYCVQTHTVVALDSGLSRQEVRTLSGQEDPETVFTAADELALIAWVDAVTLGRGAVPEDVAARAREAMEHPELVELTLVVGATLMLNRYCSALGLPTSAATLARLAQEGLG
ncbi:MAG TPA: carboxymuconolactone decarboxylase family protein [Thermoleophilaceae bacterium]|nr:carboxymuconolactone decarboxylase family protein [Thermoleophilaceae bacterium]